ncbi:MAG: hypothetical protein ACRDV7_13570, partial [Acidimicrobiia bacterium]
VGEYAFRYLQIFGDDMARMLAGLVTTTSAATVREKLSALADAGCDEVILVATTGDADELRRVTDLVGDL